MPQVRAHARLTAVAAINQQLGLALQAAGQAAASQRAFVFADEIGAMRPTMVRAIFGLDSAKAKRSFRWHWLGLVVFVFPSLGAIFMLHKLNEQRCVVPALHADDEDYKQGGASLHLSAQPLPPFAANSGAQLTGPELVDLLKREMTTSSVTAISRAFSTLSADKSATACLEQFVKEAAAFWPGDNRADFRRLYLTSSSLLETQLTVSPLCCSTVRDTGK